MLKLKLKTKNFLIKYWPIILIIVIWLVFSSPYFIKGLLPFPTKYLVDFFPPWNNFYGMPVKNNAMPDIITQIYPWKKLVIESWKQGQVPFWNPYQFAGNPHLANFQSAVFTPLNILFFILPFANAWSLLILFQSFLAGIFTYIYLRKLKVSKEGSLLSAISFMFCGFVVVWMGYGTLAYAILYLPFLLWGIERFLEKKDKLSAVLITISVPLSFFSGHFQTSLYFLGAGVLYLIFKLFQSKSKKNVLLIFVFILVGLFISSSQIIPSIQFYQQSIRSSIFQKGEVIPWNYFVTIIAPDFFGNPVTRNDWFGHYAEWAGFAGIVPLFLSFFAFLDKKKNNIIYLFLLFAVASILLAYNTPLNDLLIDLKLPVLSTSAVSRIIVLFSFSIAVLAGFGLDALIKIWKIGKGLEKIILYVLFWFLIVVAIWVLIVSNNLIFTKEVTMEKLSVAKRNFILPTLILFSAFGLSFIGFIKNKWVKYFSIAMFLAISIFDLFRFANKWMPFEEKKYLYPKIEVLFFLQKNTGNNRVFGNFYNEAQSPFKLQGIEGYDPLYIERYGEFITALGEGILGKPQRSVVKVDKNGLYTKRILDLMGVKFFFQSKGDGKNSWAFPYWLFPYSFGTAVYSDDNYEIYENTKAYSRSFLVHKYEIADSDQEIINLMLDEKTDLSKTVVLEENPAKEPEICDTERDNASITNYTPNVIEIETISDCQSILFLSDNYYPGWNVYINGQKAKILRADYTFRAVVVPEGTNKVKFAYENWYF